MTSGGSYTILFKQQKNEEQVERQLLGCQLLRFSSLFGRLVLNLKEDAVKLFSPVSDDVCRCVCLK